MDCFEVNRYLGHWYEIARRNAPFEAGCESSEAYYQLEGNTLIIKNNCLRNGRVVSTISGTGKQVKKCVGTFALEFETGQKGIYQVLYTDYEHFSLVGNQKTGYLSILSRNRYYSPGEQKLLEQLARLYGFEGLSWNKI